ncbi:hypothetical protein AAFF_G00268910 [Aldrovandia affinis]|uniref:Uncharacterized protein n=1 Tax=Aldrovandia affinis TaxID=143900 RepID=A0AAD7WSP8_9TELE|nr:hypothetical protein AAFF_G00268910 [Aldrovandia affinis]
MADLPRVTWDTQVQELPRKNKSIPHVPTLEAPRCPPLVNLCSRLVECVEVSTRCPAAGTSPMQDGTFTFLTDLAIQNERTSFRSVV